MDIPTIYDSGSTTTKFLCPTCQQSFTMQGNALRHIRRANCKTKEESNVPILEFICQICQKSFTIRSNLIRHVKDVHKLQMERRPRSHYNTCLECDVTYNTIDKLVMHLRVDHRMVFEFEEVYLASAESFKIWKEQIEESNNVRFICKQSKKTGSNILYICHRSPLKQTDGRGRDPNKVYKRKLKKQGSYKINTTCTSHLRVTVSEEGTYKVAWLKTHYGHSEDEFQHLTITKAQRNRIAAKLKSGVPRASLVQSKTDQPVRGKILTSRHIANIANNYNINENRQKRISTAESEGISDVACAVLCCAVLEEGAGPNRTTSEKLDVTSTSKEPKKRKKSAERKNQSRKRSKRCPAKSKIVDNSTDTVTDQHNYR